MARHLASGSVTSAQVSFAFVGGRDNPDRAFFVFDAGRETNGTAPRLRLGDLSCKSLLPSLNAVPHRLAPFFVSESRISGVEWASGLDLVDDHHVDATRLDVGEQTLERGPVDAWPTKPVIDAEERLLLALGERFGGAVGSRRDPWMLQRAPESTRLIPIKIGSARLSPTS